MKTKKRKRKPPKICPQHGTKMIYTPNSYGPHWECDEPGCTVRCWGGDTSSPGDKETFDERKLAHKAFDPLLGKVFERRGESYEWMSQVMGLPKSQAHIGMFTAAQCRQLRELIKTLLTKPTEPITEHQC